MSIVRFQIDRPGASRAYLVGDFNEWDPTCKRMTRTSNGQGCFVSLLDLPPGCHEFKFVVDGEWTCCPVSPTVPNKLGSENNIVEVE